MTTDKLRRTFEAMLVAEVHRHGGIPHLPPEQMELREAIAELLDTPDADDAGRDPWDLKHIGTRDEFDIMQSVVRLFDTLPQAQRRAWINWLHAAYYNHDRQRTTPCTD